eukprot:gene19483-21407_t
MNSFNQSSTTRHYYSTATERSSTTRVSSYQSSSQHENKYYSSNDESFHKDLNSNFSEHEFEALEALCSTSSSSPTKKSSIPVLKRSLLGSPEKAAKEDTDVRKEVVQGNEAKKEAKQQQKRLKKRLVRKVKKRGEREDPKELEVNRSVNHKNESENQSESQSEPQPRVVVTSKERQHVKVGQHEKVHIKFKPGTERNQTEELKQEPLQVKSERTDKDQSGEKGGREETERPERRKTNPLILTIKPPELKNAEANAEASSPESQTDSSGEEERTNRTSIQIVSGKKVKESGNKKLDIKAKSTVRDNRPFTKSSFESTDLEQSYIAEEIYRKKARKLRSRKAVNNRRLSEGADFNTTATTTFEEGEQDSAPSQGRYYTLPRNFKTVRVPLQTKKGVDENSTRNENFRRRFSADDYSKEKFSIDEKSNEKFEDRSDASQSAFSTQSFDRKLLTKQKRKKKNFEANRLKEESHFEEPRFIRRARKDRRLSNPNQILGRTDIQGLRKERPKSEVVGLRRSESLPRSAERPRVKSESYNEFVTIHDLEGFNLGRSQTLPYRKKKVSYQDGTKGERKLKGQPGVKGEEGVDSVFQKHLEEHQIFKQSVNEITVFAEKDEDIGLERSQETFKDRGERLQVKSEVGNKEVKRSQSLPRQKKTNKQYQLSEKEKQFDEFIRNQRNILIEQINKADEKTKEKGQSSKVTQGSKVKGQTNQVKGQVDGEKEKEKENIVGPGVGLEGFLGIPSNSQKAKRNKSTNDVQDIKKALILQQQQQNKLLLQDKQQTKLQHNNIDNSTSEKVIVRASAKGKIQLSMEGPESERFQRREREYEKLQQQQQQQARRIHDDRYRYMNNEFDRRNVTQQYYKPTQYDQREEAVHQNSHNRESMKTNQQARDESDDVISTRMTRVKSAQVENGLDEVYYNICTHYFLPEKHELIVNLHRYGKIKVPRGLDHDDTCIFYNHLYVYEKEDVFAETLAPIPPKIQTEVVELEDEVPVFADNDDETMSLSSSANQSYENNNNDDDAGSQYSSASRRERNLFSSFKAQKYYEWKENNNNNSKNTESFDKAFGETYETLRRKRKSTNTNTDDEGSINGLRAISPTSSSGRSDATFSYSKPRLLRISDMNPGVGHEIEDDYPRWKPKSPTQPDRMYGLSVALPP